jgi:hypothetical protein
VACKKGETYLLLDVYTHIYIYMCVCFVNISNQLAGSNIEMEGNTCTSQDYLILFRKTRLLRFNLYVTPNTLLLHYRPTGE